MDFPVRCRRMISDLFPLVADLQRVHQRSPLDGRRVVVPARNTRSHRERQLHDIAGPPFAFHPVESGGRDLALERAVDAHARTRSPPRNPQQQRETRRLLGIHTETNFVAKRIFGVFGNRHLYSPAHRRAHFTRPISRHCQTIVRSSHP